jgi:hypothetical protein
MDALFPPCISTCLCLNSQKGGIDGILKNNRPGGIIIISLLLAIIIIVYIIIEVKIIPTLSLSFIYLLYCFSNTWYYTTGTEQQQQTQKENKK